MRYMSKTEWCGIHFALHVSMWHNSVYQVRALQVMPSMNSWLGAAILNWRSIERFCWLDEWMAVQQHGYGWWTMMQCTKKRTRTTLSHMHRWTKTASSGFPSTFTDCTDWLSMRWIIRRQWCKTQKVSACSYASTLCIRSRFRYKSLIHDWPQIWFVVW